MEDFSKITERVRKVEVSYKFHKEDLSGVDFKNVTTLIFGELFSGDMSKVDLKKITFLKFGCYFNQSLENVDLKNVTTLILGSSYTQCLSKVDLKNVTTLTLGTWFNKDISRVKFKKVTKLTLGKTFDRDLSKVDFNNITWLMVGSSFRRDLSKVDFKKIKTLNLGQHRHIFNSIDFSKNSIDDVFAENMVGALTMFNHIVRLPVVVSDTRILFTSTKRFDYKTSACLNMTAFLTVDIRRYQEQNVKHRHLCKNSIELEPISLDLEKLFGELVEDCFICAERSLSKIRLSCCKKTMCPMCFFKVATIQGINFKCPFCRNPNVEMTGF